LTIPIDKDDASKVLLNQESEYAQACSMAMARVYDRIGIEAALATVVEHSRSLNGLTTVLGHIALANAQPPLGQVSKAIAHNSASVIAAGSVLGRYDKHLLPNYDVFDDWRNFIPGTAELVFEVSGLKVAVAICEDIWGPREQALRLLS
jgi:NAD+ synthase (glutamine-hydrolysing)